MKRKALKLNETVYVADNNGITVPGIIIALTRATVKVQFQDGYTGIFNKCHVRREP